MSLDEGLSRFIGTIYEAVYDADRWRSTVNGIMARTGSRLAFVATVDLRHGQYSKSEFIAPDKSSVADGRREYDEALYLTDPALIWSRRHPSAGVCDTSALMPDEEFRRLEFARWQKSRFGTVHWQVCYSPPIDDLSFALSLHPPAEAGPAPAGTRELHRLLFQHLERAVRLAARPPNLSAVGEAVIIVDDRGCVISMSARAEQLMAQNDGLELDQRRLRGGCAKVTAQLDAALGSAITSSAFGGAGGGVRLPRPTGRKDWLALISPCPATLDHLPVRSPAAVVRIIENDPQSPPQPELAELFDLSPRECDVADGILGGHSLDSLAAELGISRNTAKVHLQALFRKTATNRQSELVHLLTNLARR